MLDDERIETLKGSDRQSERERGRWLEFLAEAQASIQHGSGPRKNKYDPRYFLEYDPPEEPLDDEDDYIEPEEIEDDY